MPVDAFETTVKGPAVAPVPSLIVPPAPLELRVNVTFTPPTGLPSASRTRTLGAVAAVATVADCVCVVSVCRLFGAPAVIVTFAEAGVRPELVNEIVFAPAEPLTERLVKVATPLALVSTDVIPPSVPVPEEIEAVTEMFACETLFEDVEPSWRRSTGCDVNATPLCGVASGLGVSVSVEAAPATVVIVPEVPAREAPSVPVTVTAEPAAAFGVNVTVARPELLV